MQKNRKPLGHVLWSTATLPVPTISLKCIGQLTKSKEIQIKRVGAGTSRWLSSVWTYRPLAGQFEALESWRTIFASPQIRYQFAVSRKRKTRGTTSTAIYISTHAYLLVNWTQQSAKVWFDPLHALSQQIRDVCAWALARVCVCACVAFVLLEPSVSNHTTFHQVL